jgi:tRNA-2-methylthio-N6-dimethylallyladenosine synthase
MRRGYTRETYLNRVARLRETCPDIAITSDMIVGFPGETDDDFLLSLVLMKEIRFDNLFSFKYSEREGTAAVHFDDKVPQGIKSQRLKILQSLQEVHTLERNKTLEGRSVEVLVEGISKNSPEDVSGRTRTNKIVNFRGSGALIGQSASVRINEAFLHSLRGEIDL